MNNKRHAAAGLCFGMMLAMALPAQAVALTNAKGTKLAEVPTNAEGASAAMVPANAAEPAIAALPTNTSTQKLTRTWEVQAEYLEGRFFENRHIDDYNLHIYQQHRNVKNIGIWYGLTLSRTVGYTTDDGIYRDSGAVGLGPSMMLRWERPIAGKLTGSIDGTGSLLAYDKAHPARGRAYGFLWRIGPRLIYHATKNDAWSLTYIFHHSSNGWSTHNPGYNGVGFSLGYSHTF